MLERFDYICPKSIEEAFVAIEQANVPNMCFMAGGTDLLPKLRNKKKQADCIVDLSGLDLNYVKLVGGEIRIGSLTTFRTIIRDPIARTYLPVLVNAARQVGAVQTQSLATIGGNLCIGLPSVDSATPLMVLNAKLRIRSKDQERFVEVKDFFKGPCQIDLRNNEVLMEVIVPIDQQKRASFVKIGRRKAMSLPIINCSTSLRLDCDGLIEEARIALGSVAPTPIRAMNAEKLLVGQKPTIDLFKQAGEIASKEICPRTSIRGSSKYRVLLSEVVVKRSLTDALQQFRLEQRRD